jgi:hypothetical protein
MQAAYHRAVGKAYHEHKRSLRVFSGELELPEGEPDPDFFMERAFAKARLIYDRYVALSGGQPPQERDDIPEF